MKVENKFFIEGNEVTLMYANGATKFYKGDEVVYIVNWDDVVATVNPDTLHILAES